ncbi:MAG: hypothetical protein C3F06_14595 [Candidatus Methanoperedenaceae archaeon]|nr:MAG: hypothetical protein C3F06_14595 [Candidatus Methanoperedenaceae archaeon]
MFETSRERVQLLRKGYTQKQIEELYIKGNKIKIVNLPLLIKLVEIRNRENKKMCMNCTKAVGYAHLLCEEMVSIGCILHFPENSSKSQTM